MRWVSYCRGLGLGDVELERAVTGLSGGQKTRLALARTLFATNDLLLLDEPTNHLDGPATLWLMDYLARYEGATLLISHDLVLLDKAITRVLHLDAGLQTLTAYHGNYSSYLRQRDAAEERAVAETERQQLKITQLKTQADWARGKTEKMARKAKVLDHRIERLREHLPDAAALPRRQRKLTFQLPIARPSGRIVFRVEDLAKSYGGAPVFQDLTFELERGKRLVVIGRNGAGKTTLLKTLGRSAAADAREHRDRADGGPRLLRAGARVTARRRDPAWRRCGWRRRRRRSAAVICPVTASCARFWAASSSAASRRSNRSSHSPAGKRRGWRWRR